MYQLPDLQKRREIREIELLPTAFNPLKNRGPLPQEI